jgi:glycosyltransferase involved in cell wall biosynthesis
MKKHILYFTEDISNPLDEGVKKVAYSIIPVLPPNSTVITMTNPSAIKPFTNMDLINIHQSINRFMFKLGIWVKLVWIGNIKLIYTPSASATLGSIVKLLVMYIWFRPHVCTLIVCQPKKTGILHRFLLNRIRNLTVLSLSHMLTEQYGGLRVKFVVPDIDLTKYKPITSDEKRKLRAKYNVDDNKTVILHVGHLTENRNLYSLIPLVRDDRHILIVSSQSTPFENVHHDKIKKDMLEAGLYIMDTFIENIEEIYQLSDVYVFPVENPMGCIGVPLSILEALASGVNVVSTDFNNIGKIGDMFNGLTVTSVTSFSQKIDDIVAGNIKNMITGFQTDESDSRFIKNNIL